MIHTGIKVSKQERILSGDGKRYVLKHPDIKLPQNMTAFLRNGARKETFFNLIEQALDEDKYNLANRVLYFSNKYHCLTMSRIILEKASDHEEADTKLMALVESSDVEHAQSVMVR